jgi:hypothetical protein
MPFTCIYENDEPSFQTIPRKENPTADVAGGSVSKAMAQRLARLPELEDLAGIFSKK